MTNIQQSPPSPPRPPQQRNGCLTALMIGIGCVLLLPGICALGFASSDASMVRDPTGLLLLLICLVVSAGGVALIWAAARRPR